MDIRRGAIRAILLFRTFRKLEPIEECYSRYFAFLYFKERLSLYRGAIHAILRFYFRVKAWVYLERCYSRYFAFLHCYQRMVLRRGAICTILRFTTVIAKWI